MTKCKFNLRENLQTKSVYCERLAQWVSVKYCALCLDHEPDSAKIISNNKTELLDNYNYNIAFSNNWREARGFCHTSLKILYCFLGGFHIEF